MKIYKVKVNGKTYEVALEAVEDVKGSIEVEKKSEEPQSSGVSNAIVAPIAGKILEIKVKVGDRIKKGDTVLIVEAMKLENEVKSNYDGVVKEIKVTKGAMVANKDELVILG